jgi:hypothetical protein
MEAGAVLSTGCRLCYACEPVHSGCFSALRKTVMTSVSAPGEHMQGCSEWNRLYQLFVSAHSDIIAIQIEQSQVCSMGVSDTTHVNRLLREALIRKRQTKTALISHLKAHTNCG